MQRVPNFDRWRSCIHAVRFVVSPSVPVQCRRQKPFPKRLSRPSSDRDAQGTDDPPQGVAALDFKMMRVTCKKSGYRFRREISRSTIQTVDSQVTQSDQRRDRSTQGGCPSLAMTLRAVVVWPRIRSRSAVAPRAAALTSPAVDAPCCAARRGPGCRSCSAGCTALPSPRWARSGRDRDAPCGRQPRASPPSRRADAR